MKLILKIVGAFIANTVGLTLASQLISGFIIAGGLSSLLSLALVLTILNLIFKPVLKLIFMPFIILTLGLALIMVNAIMLYILDFLSQNLTISGIGPLILGALIVGIINFFFHKAT